MFIWTAKLRRGRLVAGVAAIVVLCGAVALVGGVLSARGVDAVSPAPASPKGIKTNEDRIAYLESYGWQVSADPLSVEELAIPEEFDETYTQYLSLQSGQGFDLEKYKGKRVKRYTYEISNYPTGETGVQAGLLIYKNTVVGGEVLSSQLGGFIHGLAKYRMPATNMTSATIISSRAAAMLMIGTRTSTAQTMDTSVHTAYSFQTVPPLSAQA